MSSNSNGREDRRDGVGKQTPPEHIESGNGIADQLEKRRRVDPREDPRHKDYIKQMHAEKPPGNVGADKNPEGGKDKSD